MRSDRGLRGGEINPFTPRTIWDIDLTKEALKLGGRDRSRIPLEGAPVRLRGERAQERSGKWGGGKQSSHHHQGQRQMDGNGKKRGDPAGRLKENEGEFLQDNSFLHRPEGFFR